MTEATEFLEIPRPRAQAITLDDLFREALTYGRVAINTSDSRKFWAHIEFETIPGTSLKAGHPGFTETPHEALRAAIDNAKEIRRAFK